MSEATLLQREERILTSIKQLGLYKLLFSQKAAFCFVLLFISTAIVVFSCWAVCHHIINPSTFGIVIVTFGGITSTLAGIYNIVHGMNDRASMQMSTNITYSPAPPLPPSAALPPNGTL